MTRWLRRVHADEDGLVAGGEALALGVVVFVVGTLLVLSAWSLVDGKLAVETAARQAARAVVEAPSSVLLDPWQRDGLADATALATMEAHRGPSGSDATTWRFLRADLRGAVVRCGAVTATVEVEVQTVRLPVLARGFGSVRMVGEHTERIEPYRAGLPVGGGGC